MVPMRGRASRKGRVVLNNQRVDEMAEEVLACQARGRTRRSGEPFEEALKTVLETEAGRQLEERQRTRGRAG
jgi:ketosteroid isomerase-like protein